jgi:hypothetical protein
MSDMSDTADLFDSIQLAGSGLDSWDGIHHTMGATSAMLDLSSVDPSSMDWSDWQSKT